MLVLASCTATDPPSASETETTSAETSETNDASTETGPDETGTETGPSDPCEAALAEDAPLGEALFACGFDPELRPSWTWVREQDDAWSVGDGVLSLVSLPGTLWEASNDTRNIALVDAPVGDFVVEVSVTGAVEIGAEQGGLMWYAGDDDYVKFVREMVGATRSVVVVTETGGVTNIDAFAQTDSNDLDLQLERIGDTFVARYRVPGDPWQALVEVTPSFPGRPQIGLFSQGDPDGLRASDFAGFSLSPG